MSLREALPVVKIPLRPQDADVLLNLQELITQVYERGRYGRSIRYRDQPIPPFSKSEAEWADQLLKEKGLR